jgi:REP element-mobilizing transposase RayT
MRPDPATHHRRSIRLKGHDYSRTGAYFVTIVTHGRELLFGAVLNGEVHLNDAGRMVSATWAGTPDIRPNVTLDEFVVMPNHFHGVLVIHEPRGVIRLARPIAVGAPGLVRGSLGAIVGQFKSLTTKRLNVMRRSPGFPVWQRNYYEHVVRDDADLDRLREYIAANPARWLEDDENPDRVRP